MNIKETFLVSAISFLGVFSNISAAQRLIVDVKNNTGSDYKIIPTKGEIPMPEKSSIVQAGHSKRFDLNELRYSDVTGGEKVHLAVKDNKDEKVLNVDIFRVWIPTTNYETLQVGLHKGGWNFDAAAVRADRRKETDFLVNLYLKGDTLQESEAETTAVER